ncbi:carbohydrate ABC transporter permease [Microbacterium sp. RD1]|uniref:carbohydrate ABC transporter permease n=1 Tax=Microbacterium sp. RD1 TaxID=3457313 RepID=UPI003FA5AD1F
MDVKNPPVKPRRERSAQKLRRSARVPWGWAFPALLLVVAIVYAADLAGAWYSLTDWTGSTSGANWVGIANFSSIIQDEMARTALLHTLLIAAVFVVLSNAIGMALAVGLARTLKTRNLLRSMFFLPVAMSPLAVSYIWKYILQYNGPLNGVLGWLGLTPAQQDWLGSPTFAIWAIIVVLIWQFSGLTMVFYLAGLQTIPVEIDEASALDGASAWYRFWKVTLPLLAPSVTVSLTFTLVLGLRVFDQVMALTAGGPVGATETLATQVYKQTFVNGQFGYGAALSVVLTILVALIGFAQLVVLRRRERSV